jgi:hypothetical protein
MGVPEPLNYSHGATQPHGRPVRGLGFAITSCCIGAMATFIPLPALYRPYQLAPGTLMPAALTPLLALCGLSSTFVAFPLAATSLWFGWRTRRVRWLAIFGLLLSTTGTLLSFFLFD